MGMSKEFIVVVAIAVAGACSSCASVPHRISHEQLSPDVSKRVYKDLLIIGVYADRPYRVSSETSFAEILKSKGIAAEPSYDLIPELSTLDSNEDVARELEKTNHDGVLVVATIDKGHDYDMEDYLESRGMVYLLGGRPGAGLALGSFMDWASSGQYSLLVSLWDTETQKLVWEITTDSTTTGSESGDIKALADFTVDELRKKGLL